MRVLKVLGALFFTYHALAIAALNFPRDNALTEKVFWPFKFYADGTDQWQNWDMFDTIPIDENIDIEAFVVYPDRTEKKIGPIVPGLRGFQSSLRLVTFFYYFNPESETDNEAWKTYSSRLCKEVAQRENSPFELYVDFIYYRLRALEDIRKDGIVSEKKVVTKRAPCD